jgi:hypothetical protein
VCLTQLVFAQVVTDSNPPQQTDSLPARETTRVVRPDTTPIVRPKQVTAPQKPLVKPDSSATVVNEPVSRDSSGTPPVTVVADTISKIPWQYASWGINDSIPLSTQVLQRHPYFGFGSQPVIVHSWFKDFKGKEIMFYALIGLLLAFAFLRQAFPKYFNDLFRLLFRTTLKQKQIREQLMQTPLPSLVLNIFYVVSAGLYVNIMIHHFDIAPISNYWLLYLYCMLGLTVVYLVKFFGLKVAGWLFNVSHVTDTYIFVVFLINKVIGIFLLPFLFLLSFMQGIPYTITLVISWCGLGVLFIYRFLLTYASVRNQVRFNPFHFFLYLCAFEIAPLLLIYKALLFFFQ